MSRVVTIGFWSVLLMILMVVLFDIGLMIAFVYPDFGKNLAYLSSFFLAWTFLASMACIHRYAPEDRKIWSQLGLSVATIYAALNTMVYYVQLVVVRTNPLNVSSASLALFVYTPGSVFFAIDMLGYGFLTLAMLLAAQVFVGGRLEHYIRWLFIVNGLIFIPTLLYPAFLTAPLDTSSTTGSLILLAWSPIFIPACALLALLFKRVRQTKS